MIVCLLRLNGLLAIQQNYRIRPQRRTALNSDEHRDSTSSSSDAEQEDFDLDALVPQYLALCRRDLVALQASLEKLDFEGVRILGHNLKGSGGAYGFPYITELGARLEQAAKITDDSAMRSGIAELKAFLDSKNT